MPGSCCLSSSRLPLYRAACEWIHTGPATALNRKHGAQGANRRKGETDQPTVVAGTEGPADRKLTFEALIRPQCVSVRQVSGYGIRWQADQVLAFVTHRHLFRQRRSGCRSGRRGRYRCGRRYRCTRRCRCGRRRRLHGRRGRRPSLGDSGPNCDGKRDNYEGPYDGTADRCVRHGCSSSCAKLERKSLVILTFSQPEGQSLLFSHHSGDLRSRASVTVPGFRTARRVASRR
jgi:hypothetical protein